MPRGRNCRGRDLYRKRQCRVQVAGAAEPVKAARGAAARLRRQAGRRDPAHGQGDGGRGGERSFLRRAGSRSVAILLDAPPPADALSQVRGVAGEEMRWASAKSTFTTATGWPVEAAHSRRPRRHGAQHEHRRQTRSHGRPAVDQHRHARVRQHLDRLAAERRRRHAAPPVAWPSRSGRICWLWRIR